MQLLCGPGISILELFRAEVSIWQGGASRTGFFVQCQVLSCFLAWELVMSFYSGPVTTFSAQKTRPSSEVLSTDLTFFLAVTTPILFLAPIFMSFRGQYQTCRLLPPVVKQRNSEDTHSFLWWRHVWHCWRTNGARDQSCDSPCVLAPTQCFWFSFSCLSWSAFLSLKSWLTKE